LSLLSRFINLMTPATSRTLSSVEAVGVPS
jgi:hypothetical protein